MLIHSRYARWGEFSLDEAKRTFLELMEAKETPYEASHLSLVK
jgi:hypothetical protein